MMIPEKELIGKIRQLRQIRPRKDWVLLTKSQILGGAEPKRSLAPFWGFLLLRAGQFFHIAEIFSPFRYLNYKNYKPALVAIVSTIILISGIFSFAQDSLPGDLLYPVKKITERGRAVFVSETDKPELNLELANKRLEELTKIAETNQVRKLAPALEEYQASVVQATENLKKVKAEDSSKLRKEIVQQTQKLEEKKQILENIYGVAGLEGEEGSNPTKIVVEWLIADLEERSLTEDQQEVFAEAEEDFEAGDYNQALEKILLISK